VVADPPERRAVGRIALVGIPPAAKIIVGYFLGYRPAPTRCAVLERLRASAHSIAPNTSPSGTVAKLVAESLIA
jgi:hypothetical protein